MLILKFFRNGNLNQVGKLKTIKNEHVKQTFPKFDKCLINFI